MKMLFKVGKMVNKSNQDKKIHFISADEETEIAFSDSVDRVIGIFSVYDLGLYGTVNNKEIFYLYDKRTKRQDLCREISSIIAGNDSNILNREDVLIRENVYDDVYDFVDNETIFWDTINHLIIIIGRESLMELVKQIEKSRWEKWLGKNSDSFASIIPEEGLSFVYRKTINMQK